MWRDPGGGDGMLVTLDILDDRLEAIGAADDRERLRAYLALWREGRIDPLGDRDVVVIVDPGGGLRPLVANDGEGAPAQ